MTRPTKLVFNGTSFAGNGVWNTSSNTSVSVIQVSSDGVTWNSINNVSDPSGTYTGSALGDTPLANESGFRQALTLDAVTISNPAQGTMNNTAYAQLLTDISNANTEILNSRVQYFGEGTRLPGGTGWILAAGTEPNSPTGRRGFAVRTGTSQIALQDEEGVWIPGNLPASAPWSCAAVGNGYYMVVAGTSTSSSRLAFMSSDGENWVRIYVGGAPRYWSDIVSHQNKFIIIPGTATDADVLTLYNPPAGLSAGAGFSVPVVAADHDGSLVTTGTITGGSGYTNGTYTNVAVLGSKSGATSARATITVTGGAVTSFVLSNVGLDYTGPNSSNRCWVWNQDAHETRDILTFYPTGLAAGLAAGSGFSVGVVEITANSMWLDSIQGGSGYTNGTYTGVRLQGSVSNANTAEATITVTNGRITGCVLTNLGSGYIAPNGSNRRQAGTLPATADWRSITSDGNSVVAVRLSSGSAARSINGLTWSSTTLPSGTDWIASTTGWSDSTHNFQIGIANNRTYSNVTAYVNSTQSWTNIATRPVTYLQDLRFDTNPTWLDSSQTYLTEAIPVQAITAPRDILLFDWNGTGVPDRVTQSLISQPQTANRAGQSITLARVPGSGNPDYRSFVARIYVGTARIFETDVRCYFDLTFVANEGSKTNVAKTNWYLDNVTVDPAYDTYQAGVSAQKFSNISATIVLNGQAKEIFVSKPTTAVNSVTISDPSGALNSDLTAGRISRLIHYNNKLYVDQWDTAISWYHCYPGDQLVADAASLVAAGVTAYDGSTLEFRATALSHNYLNYTSSLFVDTLNFTANGTQIKSTGAFGSTDRPGFTRVKYLAPTTSAPTARIVWRGSSSGPQGYRLLSTSGSGSGLLPGFQFETTPALSGRNLVIDQHPYFTVSTVNTSTGAVGTSTSPTLFVSGSDYVTPKFTIGVNDSNVPDNLSLVSGGNGFVEGQLLQCNLAGLGDYQGTMAQYGYNSVAIIQVTGVSQDGGAVTSFSVNSWPTRNTSKTGLTFDVQRTGNMYTSVTINAGGTSYAVGDIREIPGSSLGGNNTLNSIWVKVTAASSGVVTAAQRVNANFAITSGPTAKFTITAQGQTYQTVTLANSDTGFSTSQVLMINGRFLQGTYENNTVLITVTGVDGSGRITAFTRTGTAADPTSGITSGTIRRNHNVATGETGIRQITVTSSNLVAAIDDQFVITGSTLKGFDVTNDITVRVTALQPDGKISALEYVTGTIPRAAIVLSRSGSSNQIVRSIDSGVNWTAYNLPSTSTWSALGSGVGNMFIAVPNTTTGAFSSDGITWTAETLLESQNWSSIIGDGTRLVMVGSDSRYPQIRRGGVWRRYQDEYLSDWIETQTTAISRTTGTAMVAFGTGRLRLLGSLLKKSTGTNLDTLIIDSASTSQEVAQYLSSAWRDRRLVWLLSSATGAVDTARIYPISLTVTQTAYTGTQILITDGTSLYSLPTNISATNFNPIIEAGPDVFGGAITGLNVINGIVYVATAAKTFTSPV